MFSSPKKAIDLEPFRLLSTHCIESTSFGTTEEHFKFLILAYGFLHGLHLLPEGHMHLSRTPYRVGELTGLVPQGSDLQQGMSHLNHYYEASKPECKKQIFATLHWFLMGQSYRNVWDQFDAQYKVLDSIHSLAKKQRKVQTRPRIPHATVPQRLAKIFGAYTPEWAIMNKAENSCELSKIRNDFIHDAIYSEQAIGYKHSKINFGIEFPEFNLKLICGILGLKTDFIQRKFTRGKGTWNFYIS
ncbi:hypothetical protein [Desulfovibrio sp. JC010]|uniref:hypothetical protein n=1 Tax=Desulfovibrio sp. JC010 TaxID=2593641 RepID=UPI0013D86436|nr:hypothetical protein [Desulfovibrio sp. JC010]NDV26107.1 hypothetical protein [Desulfovibrio sp. JC010]